MIAIGAGGLDVAVAMAKGTYSLTVPKVINVKLVGELGKWVSAKDIILKVLKELTVKGGVGKIVEYSGDGVKTLSVTDRATISIHAIYDSQKQIPSIGFPISSFRNYFISLHYPSSSDSLLFNSMFLSEKDKKIIANMKKDDNPLLIFFELKDF